MFECKEEVLRTWQPIADPHNDNRQWAVRDGAMLTPMASYIDKRFFSVVPTTAKRKWFFPEKDAHMLVKTAWPEWKEGMANYVFVYLPTPALLADKWVYGFVVNGTDIDTEEAVINLTLPEKKSETHWSKKELVTSFLFASKSGPLKKYETRVYADKTVSCNCRGWATRRKCWHINEPEVRAALDKL